MENVDLPTEPQGWTVQPSGAWYDAEDARPYVVCLVELSNGKRVKGRFAAGDWETLNGEQSNPVRWTPLGIQVVQSLYSINDLL